MWGVKPVYSHLWAKSEFNQANFGLDVARRPQYDQMSTTETQPTERNSDKHLFVNIMRKKRQFYLILQATPVRQKPGPRKILSKEMSSFTQEECCCLSLLSFISFKRHMYRGVARKEERELHSPTATCFKLAVDVQLLSKTTELSLIALQRTHLSGFLLRLLLHSIIQD